MKKITAVFAFAALLLGTAGAFATTTPASSKEAKFAEQWYFYNGGGESNPAHYTLAGSTPTCQLGSALCAVKTSADGSGQPIVPQTDPNKRKMKN